MQIGKKIRQIRQMRNFTLQDVADKTNLTVGLLSQVERDLVSPSIQTLRCISMALGVPIVSFFEESDETTTIVRKNKRRTLRLEGSKLTYELLCPDLGRRIEFLMTILEPGSNSADIPLGHPGSEEVLLILNGKVELILGGETHVLDDGDSAYIGAGVPHKITNIGDTAVSLISAFSPPTF
jgi:transcriptional regulator with XRE-family HTH domain